MYQEIREEIKQPYYQQNFRTEGERFVAWYLRNVLQRDQNQTIDDIANVYFKPRDLQNDGERVLKVKMLFEQKYPQGSLLTKRAQEPPADKDKTYVIDVFNLGKCLVSWYSQRPNTAYSERKVFGKYFKRLFKREYDPENIQALNFLMREIMKRWTPNNPFGLNESLLAMKAHGPYHVLYAISQLFAVVSNHPNKVPSPKSAFKRATDNKVMEQIVRMAASSVNVALEVAANEQHPTKKILSPQNWMKAKTSLSGIKTAVGTQLVMLKTFSNGLDLEALVLPAEDFEDRWEVD